MTIAVMQPYFFPYIGQFQLINAVERFILCDDVQYIRHGWINRNRVLKQQEGVCYINMPLSKHSSTAAIRDVKAVDGDEWKTNIFKQLNHYKKHASNYNAVTEVLKQCFATRETSVTKINAHCLQCVCQYLGIPYRIEITSEMGLDYSDITTTDQWAINITRQVGGTRYLNPPGGTGLYDKDKFASHNISLEFVNPLLKEYDQHRPQFEQRLSIIDVMMFNTPAEIREMLTQYELI